MHEAGRYEATIYYTCAPENVGAEIELEFQGKTTRGTITEAHNPPLIGEKFDRSPRESESYVKDFKPLKIGVIDLTKTRGPLTLHALKIPGTEAADVRYVMLEKADR